MDDRTRGSRAPASPDPRAAVGAIVLGIGLGGLFDGIVLHQVLQWHHLVSTPVPPVTVADLELNTLADGLFHVVAWLLTVAGVFVLAAADPSTRIAQGTRGLVGGGLIGWGLFNLVEGLIDHHLLGLHHVRPGPDALLYDVAFLGWGAGMLVLGLAVLRRVPDAAPPSP